MKSHSNFLKNKSKGFTLAELTIVAAILGSITYYGAEQQEVKSYTNNLVAVENDVQQMQLAYNQFYLEFRRPPADLNELATQGFYNGPLISPFGSPYVGAPSARGYQFSIDTGDDRSALVLSERQPNANSISSTQVGYSFPVPTVESIASQYLHRTAIAGRPELNQMETTLDMTGNDIINVLDLDVGSIVTERITTNVAEIDVLKTVDELEFGNNSISASGNVLTFNANTVNISNDLNVIGNLLLNNTNLSGVNQLSANSGTFDTIVTNDLEAQTATITTLDVEQQNVDTLVSTTATINSIDTDNLLFNTATGNSLTVSNADVTNLESENAIFQNGTFNDLTSVNITANNGTINNLTSTTINTNNINVNGLATISSANIGDLVSNTINTANFTGNNGVINVAVVGSLSSINTTTQNLTTDTLTSNGTADFDEATINDAVIDTATIERLRVLNTLLANNADFIRATGQRIDFDDLNGQVGRFQNLDVSGTITAGSANFDSADINSLSANNFNSDTATINTLNSTSMTVSNTLTAQNINGNSANFTGNVSMNNLSVNSLTMNSFDIDEINADTIRANEVIGGDFSGVNFFASNDFTTAAGNSVNNNKALYDSINSLWLSCVADDGCQ